MRRVAITIINLVAIMWKTRSKCRTDVKQLQRKDSIDTGWKNEIELLNKSHLQALEIICRASRQEMAISLSFPNRSTSIWL